jgi:hypothetical protein
MRSKVFIGKIGALMLFCSGLSLPGAAQGVGAIGGTIMDTSGAALPGATVALANPGVIGGDQEAVTDGRGAYQFNRLVPGTYRVRASLTGFRAAVQEAIVVYADATARVDLRLGPVAASGHHDSVDADGANPRYDRFLTGAK